MVRAYRVKAEKNKMKRRLEEEEEPAAYRVKAEKNKKKRKLEEEEEPAAEARCEDDGEISGGGEEKDGGEAAEAGEENERRAEEDIGLMARIPVLPPVKESKQPGVIFLLEKACLEVAKVGKNFQILNSDDHVNYLKKQNLNPADYRPDIIHQALLAILDSPLTKAGRLKALYVRTKKDVLFEVKPYVRMPRTFKRFCGLMLQLLQNLSITAAGKREKLLTVIKTTKLQHLLVNSRRIGLSYSSEKVVQLQDYVAAASDDDSLVFVVGAMAHGKIDKDYTDDYISVSNYPLSAACCIGKICNALEQKWKIL